MLDQVIVLIPALNEEASLPLVLRSLPAVRRVIVIDNGSTDCTAKVAKTHGATVAMEPRRGYGAAMLRGLSLVAKLVESGVENQPTVIAFIDADFSDHGELLPTLVEPIIGGEADFVLGSRLRGKRQAGAMPWQSVWGNRLACFLMRVLFFADYTDLGPFRAIRYDALRKLRMTDTNFGWTIEMQIKATRCGLRIREIPVAYRRRVGKSKISGTVLGSVKAGATILYTVAKYARSSNRDAAVNSVSEKGLS